MRRELFPVASILAACALTLALAAPARGAQTIKVTSTADTVDPSPANGVCELPCSLRAAIQTANGAGSPGADTITVPAGTYNRTVGGADGADPAATGDLDVSEGLTITGAGQATTTIDAKSLERGFDIAPGVTATISRLTITGGLASDGPSISTGVTTTGGGIRVGKTGGLTANLTVNDVTLRANSARHGAGVVTEGAAVLTLNRVSVLDNVAPAGSSEGGGVNEFAALNEPAGGSIAINNSLVKGNTAISGAGVTEDGGGSVTITDSTVTENHAAANTNGLSGGVYETGGGTVTITRSTVSKNTAGDAGGVSEDGGGTVTIEDSTISGNTATTGFATAGGVLRDGGGTVTIRGSTISANTAGIGAGIFNFGTGGTFEVSNTTISGNHATTIGAQPAGTTGRGGGIHAERAGALGLTNVTLRNNLADAGATQIDNCTGPPACSGAAQTITPRNTIVAGAGTNCFGPITSGGHNLDSANSCAFTGTGDLINKNPLLGPLADNGGSTLTRALLAGSPAIDAGANSACPGTDQRGVPRPQPTGGKCDIGAFERVRDRSAPTITIFRPAGAAHYKQGQKVLAAYSCSDTDGPADVAFCQGPAQIGKAIDTSTPGRHRFTVHAADKAGNTSQKTVRYTVDTTQSSPPSINGFPPNRGCVPHRLKLRISVHPTNLTRVAVFLDGKQIRESTKPKFKLTIPASALSPGRHKLLVERDYKSGTVRRSSSSFAVCSHGGRSPHIRTEGTPDSGSCTAAPFKIAVTIKGADLTTIAVKLNGKLFSKPGKAKFTLTIDTAKLKPGRHRLLIRAADRFKNLSMNTTDFVRCA